MGAGLAVCVHVRTLLSKVSGTCVFHDGVACHSHRHRVMRLVLFVLRCVELRLFVGFF